MTNKCIYVFLLLSVYFNGIAQSTYNIPIPDGNLHITTYGQGEPILIINGGPGMNSEGFTSLAEELGKNNLAILYDQRGTGNSSISEVSTKTMTMDFMVDDIEVIRNHFKFEQWIVLGHSFGGMLASYYVSKHPENIKALILSGSGGYDLSITRNLNLLSKLSQTERDSLNYWNRQISQGDTTYQARYNRGKYLAPAYIYDKKHTPIIAERLTQGNRTINTLIWQNIRAIDFNCTEAYKNFKQPVLIIQGKKDVMDVSIAKSAHELLTNSQLVFIDKCAHYGWLEQPEIYYQAIEAFLSNK
ncbi:alpha/beta fold hydrolase [Xanthomarina spongicola]|uniref:Proline iminopeptidase n=1 Tax=Xanthomarina spongicola TaxID=570520 RepID=A0A316DWM7_9FLAO|nr:alpha/beta fold hydrolase [Xanthomarina spongicola]PWK20993.1 proline iminopeptidase [Xanthomarina spongicola]